MDMWREIGVMRPGDTFPGFPGAGVPERVEDGAVIEVGVLAHRALRSGRRGVVAAVFERSLYAVLDGCWICIGAKDLGSGPLHLQCQGIEPQRFTPGKGVAIVDRTILVDDMPFSGLETASIWAPPPSPDWTLDSLQAGLTAVDEVWRFLPIEQGLVASGGVQSPARPSRVLAAAAPGLAAFKLLIEAGLRGQRCASRDYKGIVALIGLGPGLTPSGDDLLGGALVALGSLGRLATRDALWRACRAQLGRTNEISAAHLRSAALGYAAAALHEAIDATMSGQVERIKPALAALSRIGHSSGLDAFAGALMVLRAAECRLLCDGALRDSSLAVNARQRSIVGV
jgi:hypothetical protein